MNTYERRPLGAYSGHILKKEAKKNKDNIGDLVFYCTIMFVAERSCTVTTVVKKTSEHIRTKHNSIGSESELHS